jgi:hypothetical protein
MNNWCICWFSRILLLGILIFKGLTARRLYKSFGVIGLMTCVYLHVTLFKIIPIVSYTPLHMSFSNVCVGAVFLTF